MSAGLAAPAFIVSTGAVVAGVVIVVVAEVEVLSFEVAVPFPVPSHDAAITAIESANTLIFTNFIKSFF